MQAKYVLKEKTGMGEEDDMQQSRHQPAYEYVSV